MASESRDLLSLAPFSSTSPSRLQALYSDFSRQLHSNPSSYQANIEWWHKALALVVGDGLQLQANTMHPERLILHAGSDLAESLRLDRVGKPLSLGAVVTELRTRKSLMPISEFLNSKLSIYDSGWLPMRIASHVVGKPLWWALEQLGVVGEEGLITSGAGRHHSDTTWWGDHVFVKLLERAADAVEEVQRKADGGPGQYLYSWHEFRTTFASVVGCKQPILREADAKVLVKYLQRDRRVLAVDDDVIKFVSPGASDAERGITTVDRGLLELKAAIASLNRHIESLQVRIEEYTETASAALRQNQRTVALNHIRSRKQLTSLLEKRLGSLHTLEHTLVTVDAAVRDVEIMKTYESSTAALRAILAHPSLRRSNIDRTLAALEEANEDAREVNDALRFTGDAMHEMDESAVEAELRALVEELDSSEKRQETVEMERRLPDLPQTASPRIEPGQGSSKMPVPAA